MSPSFPQIQAHSLHCTLHRSTATFLREESKAEGVGVATFSDEKVADCAIAVVKFGVFCKENVADLFDSSELALREVPFAFWEVFVAEWRSI